MVAIAAKDFAVPVVCVSGAFSLTPLFAHNQTHILHRLLSPSAAIPYNAKVTVILVTLTLATLTLVTLTLLTLTLVTLTKLILVPLCSITLALSLVKVAITLVLFHLPFFQNFNLTLAIITLI